MCILLNLEKHGSAKAHIVGVDTFTGKKHETFGPTGSNILAPFIVKKEYQLLDINDDGYLSLMTDDGDEKCDIKLKEDEIGLKLKKVFENDKDSSSIMVQTICAMDVEQVVDIKVN
ncbi:hypothetical protein ABK040_004238 [Willaertia magna]